MAASLAKPIERLYDVVARSPNLAADSAFVAALPHLSTALQRAAVEKLFDRGHLAGLSALVAGFSSYNQHLQSLIAKRVGGLFEATRAAMASDSADVRLSAIELIRASQQCGLAYLLCGVLTRRCPKTTAAAAEALLAVTGAVLDRRARVLNAGAPAADRCRLRQDTELLCDALRGGLDGWNAHFRTEVLIASMWLCDLTEPILFRDTSSTRANLARALNEALRGNSSPLMAPHAIRALLQPDLRTAAAKEIGGNDDAGFVDRLLDEAWITLDPANAKSCSWIRELCWTSERSELLKSLSGQRARAAARFVALSGIGHEEKLAIYKRMVFSGSAALHEAALWQVTRIDTPEATKLLHRVAAARVESLSQIAAHELFRRDPKPPRETGSRAAGFIRRAKPAGSHGQTEHPDSARPATTDFEAFWDQYDFLDKDQRAGVGRRLRAQLPAFLPVLRAKLSAADRDDRLRALNIVRELGITADFEERIYALAHDPEEKVRSLAIALLSQLEGTTAVRILRQALNDPDGRVQANAVEVLAALGVSDERKSLAPKLAAEHNRIRANAVEALLRLRVREAAVALIEMLNHKSGAHRISALWVVERLGLTTLVPRVQRIARDDPDQRVRERAAKILSNPLLLPTAASNGDPTPEAGA